MEVGVKVAKSSVPAWNARGPRRLPPQGIACLDLSDDGRFVAVGTISPPGDPNVILLDAGGKIIRTHRAGLRWIGEVVVSNDGRALMAYCTTPQGTAGDSPRLYAFRGEKQLPQIGGRFRAGRFLFHYGDHSNHVPRVSRRAGDRWVIAADDRLHWLSPADDTAKSMPLHSGMTTTFAASPSGRAVVGRFGGDGKADLLVVDRGEPKPLWSRPVSADVAASPKPEEGVYGPAVPPYQDRKFQVPLAVTIDRKGKRVGVADYQGWQRVFRPRDGSDEIVFGRRVMPSRPTIHVYGVDGNTVRRVGPKNFREPFWCDLAFSPDGGKLLISPHNWPSRGLGGEPLLPADETARDVYILDIGSGDVDCARFPDAVCSASWVTGDRFAVACWDHRLYLLDGDLKPIPAFPRGLDVGAAGLVRVSPDGKRIAVATTAGTVRMLDPNGRQLWRSDLSKSTQPGEKPWTKNQKPGRIAPGIWRTNGGMAHSDMGGQYLIEAPQGLILIDPNAAASFEQNWARIRAAGLDPMRVRYVLLTHEHGDHAPGSYLWRVATGARVVAGAETAYILRHHLPGGTGYGLHPPNPVDLVLTKDQPLDLAGLKVKAVRVPGHTYGSMGYVFTKQGRTYAAIGDLIMPGGVLGYSGSLDFSAADVLASLRKLAAHRPDEIIGGHGGGGPDNFIAKGIEAGEATGWSRMTPPKPNPLYRFKQTNYVVAAWLAPIQSAAYGDIDGDGRIDVAMLAARGKGSVVRIYLNKGGKFPAAADAEIHLPELSRGWKLRIGRVNEDKTVDLFASSHDRTVVLISEKGRLKFRRVPIPGTTRATHFLTGDFNGDRRTDILIGSRFVGGHAVAYQNDDGTFRLVRSKAPGRTYFDMQLADVNGDQRDDLLFSCGDILLRRPGGSIADAPAIHLSPPAGEQRGWTFLAAADFDKDGWTDVAMMAGGRDGATVWLYRNTRNPRRPFTERPTTAFVARGTSILRDGPTVADWNGDGISDLVLPAQEKTVARILLGSRADGLSPKRVVSLPLDYTPHYDTRLGVADFNGDARADLAGFGPSAVGAIGVYIQLQQAASKK